jgi:hypothetical protein
LPGGEGLPHAPAATEPTATRWASRKISTCRRGMVKELLLDGVPVEPGDGAQPPGHGGAGPALGFQFWRRSRRQRSARTRRTTTTIRGRCAVSTTIGMRPCRLCPHLQPCHGLRIVHRTPRSGSRYRDGCILIVACEILHKVFPRKHRKRVCRCRSTPGPVPCPRQKSASGQCRVRA